MMEITSVSSMIVFTISGLTAIVFYLLAFKAYASDNRLKESILVTLSTIFIVIALASLILALVLYNIEIAS